MIDALVEKGRRRECDRIKESNFQRSAWRARNPRGIFPQSGVDCGLKAPPPIPSGHFQQSSKCFEIPTAIRAPLGTRILSRANTARLNSSWSYRSLSSIKLYIHIYEKKYIFTCVHMHTQRHVCVRALTRTCAYRDICKYNAAIVRVCLCVMYGVFLARV